jgi:hypothetical protein
VGMAVERARFAQLQAREATEGFIEHPVGALTPFFRKGRIGSWRTDLPPPVVRRIVEDHGGMMRRLGYDLAEAEAVAQEAVSWKP